MNRRGEVNRRQRPHRWRDDSKDLWSVVWVADDEGGNVLDELDPRVAGQWIWEKVGDAEWGGESIDALRLSTSQCKDIVPNQIS